MEIYFSLSTLDDFRIANRGSDWKKPSRKDI